MGSILWDSVILFLLIYALLDLFVRLSDWLISRFSRVPKKESYLLLFLSGKEELLEAKLRPLLRECEQEGRQLLAVDNGIDAEDYVLLSCLMAEYDCLLLTSKEELSELAEQKEMPDQNSQASEC